ncbi:hypothetical protein [Thermus sp.]|uniref:hypothetical protein n=1 Tax=Thermus sp. TaxID=275 RepID=UPI0025DAAE75|nr:hypothetical protein [Thermus sp.]MCS6867195.1 hypothetical protein [Thermus sp.]
MRYTPPDYPELPTYQPTINLSISPATLTNPGTVTLTAWTSVPSATEWVQISWGGSQLGLEDPSGGSPRNRWVINPTSVQGCPQVSISTRHLDWWDNGIHNFTAMARVYWRERWAWYTCNYDTHDYSTTRVDVREGSYPGYPYYGCTYGGSYWKLMSEEVSTSGRLVSYISWEQALDYDGVYREFANRIVEDHKKARASMLAYAYAREVPEPVRGALAKVAQGYFYDCNWLGICDRADPAGEIKILTDVPSILSGLLYTGRLCGGLITFCFGAQNSRGADNGPKVEIKTFLMVKGWRHDYILLDRLIGRRYYDPANPEYAGVPQEERNQVLQGCRTYKDTQEGRRCVALVETPTGIVATLKTLLMVDPMFNRGRQYP